MPWKNRCGRRPAREERDADEGVGPGEGAAVFPRRVEELHRDVVVVEAGEERAAAPDRLVDPRERVVEESEEVLLNAPAGQRRWSLAAPLPIAKAGKPLATVKAIELEVIPGYRARFLQEARAAAAVPAAPAAPAVCGYDFLIMASSCSTAAACRKMCRMAIWPA